MNSIKLYLIITFLVFSNFILAQDSLAVYKSIELDQPVSFFEIDQIGNIYCVNKNEIIKINNDGDNIYRYSNMTFGAISEIDVNNSLRPLVFYKEQSKIIVLDNTLSVQDNSIINLDELQLYNTQTIANSNIDNGIWIYNIDLKQLVKVNTKMEIVQESGNLAILLNRAALQPKKMIEKNGRLYMSTVKDGVLIFDLYCSYLQSIDIQDATNFQVSEEFIIAFNQGKTCVYNTIDHHELTHINPKKYLCLKKFKNTYIALTLNGKSLDFLR